MFATAQDVYFQEGNTAHALLNAEEERSLLIRAQEGDRSAVAELLKMNQRLVVDAATYKARRSRGIELMDLIQIGNIGLMEAIKRFEVHRGHRFSTYALWWVRATIRRGANNAGTSLSGSFLARDRITRLRQARSELMKTLHREATLEELAAAVSLPVRTVEELLPMLTIAASLDSFLEGANGEEPESGFELLADCSAGPEDEAEEADSVRFAQGLAQELLDYLPKTWQAVIRLRFGMEDGTPRTCKEIGELLGFSRQRAQQIEQAAMKELKIAAYKLSLKQP